MIERVLVVDDDQSLREFLTITLGRDGFEVVAAASGPEALRAMAESPADLALVDLKMPGMDGLETLRRLKELSETVAVVIVTAFATTETAIQALKEGAYDYLIKPFKIDELKLVVRKALEERRLRWENQRLRREVELRYTLGNMVGKSTKVQELFATISRLAESRATVLLTGESGTGKTLLAKTIHFNSSRKNGPFVGVNCAAIPSELMESELFGHVRGAFTGAIANKQGLFETADGGTLLLDEISEMSTHLQAKLLRVLEDKEIRPVGGTKPVRVDVRIVAATNRDLAQAMARGTFREDLFYRLNVISVDPAVPARATGGHPAPRQPLPAEVHRAVRGARQGPVPRGAGVPRGVRLAGEHPGAGERHRAGRHPRAGSDHPPREPAGLASPAPGARRLPRGLPGRGSRSRQGDGADRARPHPAGARARRRRAEPGGAAARHRVPLLPLSPPEVRDDRARRRAGWRAGGPCGVTICDGGVANLDRTTFQHARPGDTSCVGPRERPGKRGRNVSRMPPAGPKTSRKGWAPELL